MREIEDKQDRNGIDGKGEDRVGGRYKEKQRERNGVKEEKGLNGLEE